MTLLLTRAYRFAAELHSGQRRKGSASEPYINHLAEVAELVAEANRGRDVNLVVAAVRHDVLEDTPASFGAVAAAFGEEIAELVAEVTDDKSLPKDERKRLQVQHAPDRSPRAKVLKLVDNTSNLRAIATSAPAGWSPEIMRAYVKWARSVAAGLRGVNP